MDTRDGLLAPPATRSRGEVHLWYLEPRDIAEPALAAACEALMTPAERERHGRFHFAHSRQEYLTTRALVRGVLSRYVDRPPAAWRFEEREERGKPELVAPPGAEWIRFNLSNTHGLVVCGISNELEIGVDVEDPERGSATAKIARRYFSPFEVAALSELSAPAARHRFFEYWTLKESYIKARGLGLSIPLEEFSFHLDEGPEIRISFHAELAKEEVPEQWSFWQQCLLDHHQTAVAVCDPSASLDRLEVLTRPFSPLLQSTTLPAR